MGDVRLLIQYRLRGDNEYKRHGAVRIKVDSTGTLTLIDAFSGASIRIDISQVDSLAIQEMMITGMAA